MRRRSAPAARAPTPPPALEKSWRGLSAFAIGHSTHPLPHFLKLLEGHGIRALVDVRTLPASRAQPQFNRAPLCRALQRAGVHYEHLAELGGRRYGIGKYSPNDAWRNKGFRGYADHMMSEEFEAGIETLRQRVLASGPTAFMCAEGLRWRCHRALIADVLLVRGADVRHIESPVRAVPHTLTGFAQVWKGLIAYPDMGDARR